ncbi:hypothetical protein E2P63_05150 [Candidatus Bathyarchaeota archaeon]|nr:hypothetical protein E2P63_05150 [Candidatus Bathyarchaeota archaeon]
MKERLKIKTNKLCALATVLMILAYVAPLTVYAAEQASGQGEPAGEGKYPEIPGVPENAVQYNKTEVTPVAQMEQVAAGEPALFQYRNMTMLMNCSRNCELIFTADPEVTPKILGLSVDPNQTMTLTLNMYRSPLQGEMVMERTLNFYLGIEPNAELKLSAQIRLHIDQSELSQELNREVNMSRLTWMYWNRTQAEWETVESYMDQNGYLVCNTNHFSTWTVAEIAETSETQDNTGSGIPVEYVFAGVAAAIVVVAVGVFVYKKRN